MKFRPLDAAVFFLAAGLTVFCAFRVYGGREGRLHLSVTAPEGNWLYPLDRAETLEFRGPLGLTTVELSDGGARVIASPCANKTCMASGIIRRRGQWIACLPNAVSLAVEGAEMDDGLDAAAW